MPVEVVAVSFIDGTGKLYHNLKTFYWLSNVLTLSVPDYQKHMVRTKFDIYVFIVVSSTSRLEHLTITPIKLHLKLSITKRHCRPLTLRNPYKTPEHELREKRSN